MLRGLSDGDVVGRQGLQFMGPSLSASISPKSFSAVRYSWPRLCRELWSKDWPEMPTGLMNGDIGCRSEIAVGSPLLAWRELHTLNWAGFQASCLSVCLSVIAIWMPFRM